ncbi:hypothetical protein ABID14_000238 [Peptoniphilus olsenii]|uniref:Uncharacterized protein n=1 Tax=Peptoniphilus olsenii TaxID=411570 RepID=A0ABV2J763_9FIRM
MNQVQRIIKRWEDIVPESQMLTMELKKAEYLYLKCTDEGLRVEIKKNINDIKGKIRQLESEYEYLSELVSMISNREVAI